MIKSIFSSDPFGDKRVTTYSWGSTAIFLDEDPLPILKYVRDDATILVRRFLYIIPGGQLSKTQCL